MTDTDCDCDAENSKPSPNEYPQKFHKFIKKTLQIINYPGNCECKGVPLGQDGSKSTHGQASTSHISSLGVNGHGGRGSSHGSPQERQACECHNHHTKHGLQENSSSIFERSLEANSHSIISNPETPLHYSIENYTSPILDTTTEILCDPKVDFKDVKLNCYCQDEPRPRSRSIISMSLINSLDSTKDDRIERTDDRNQNDRIPEQKHKENSYEQRASKNGSKESVESNGPNFRTQMSPRKEGLRLSRSNSDFNKHLESTLEHQTIEFYSFADMVNNETLSPHSSSSSSIVDLSPTEIGGHGDRNINLEQSIGEMGYPASPIMSPPRRRGSYTISVKDYIGV